MSDDPEFWARRLNEGQFKRVMGLSGHKGLQHHMKKRIFLITGYAQSGKDTLADALIKELGGTAGAVKMSFADPLKAAANESFKHLGLNKVDFCKEEWKKKHRKVLVAIAEAAREENIDVFADACAKEARRAFRAGKSILIPDWRYVNECEIFEKEFGKDIVRIRVWKKQGRPGNPSEQSSIQAVEDSCVLNYVGVFADGDTDSIANFGKHIVSELQ